MVLDPANNLAATELTASVSDTATTFPVTDASVFPDAPTEGAFNVLVWDSEATVNPVDAPDAEFVRVTATDTTADELTVQRGQEDTAAVSHPSGAAVRDTWTAKDRDDIESGFGATVSPTPPNTGPGETWVNPDTGVFSVSYDGEWHPIPPVTQLDEAVTFAESDVTVSHTNTTVTNNSIALQEKSDTQPHGSDTSDTFVRDLETGIEFVPNETIAEIEATLLSYCRGYSRFRVIRASDGTVVAENTNVGPSDRDTSETISVTGEFTAGTNYYLVIDNDGSQYFVESADSSPNFPYESDLFDVVAGRDPEFSSNYYWNFKSITAFTVRETAGEAIVEWPPASDIMAWDIATFQKSLDGETATVDVLDGSNSVLFSDIGRNFDISTLPTSTNVKLRVALSRNNVENNPTLDYAARRFVR